MDAHAPRPIASQVSPLHPSLQPRDIPPQTGAAASVAPAPPAARPTLLVPNVAAPSVASEARLAALDAERIENRALEGGQRGVGASPGRGDGLSLPERFGQPTAKLPSVGAPAASVKPAAKPAAETIASPVAKPAPDSFASAVTAAAATETTTPSTVLAGCAAALAAVASVAALGAGVGGGGGGGAAQDSAESGSSIPVSYCPPDAVLVVGASGRVGSLVVDALVRSGRGVVAGCLDVSDNGRGRKRLAGAVVDGGLGLAIGGPEAAGPGTGGLALRAVDVTSDASIAAALDGCGQIVVATGSRFGRQSDGSMGYFDGMTPERVDAEGNERLARAAAAKWVEEGDRGEATPDVGAGPRAAWRALDDVIMGGRSSSQTGLSDDVGGTDVLTWRGTLVAEGGGFCGAQVALSPTDGPDGPGGAGAGRPVDLSGFDGVALRARCPDGVARRFKVNIKTADLAEAERVYQATFDVPARGDWAEVRLPWRAFVGVRKTVADPSLPALSEEGATRVTSVALVLSRFGFNKFPAALGGGAAGVSSGAPEGPFSLDVEGGVRGWRAPRPRVVVLSSAGVERSARHGDDVERRKLDVPIVQLNPGGILEHKYRGENAWRRSGVRYVIVRSTGMVDGAAAVSEADDVTDGKPHGVVRLDVCQGDAITGRVTRADVASFLAGATMAPEAVGKTAEIRQSVGPDDLDALLGPTRPRDQLARCVADDDRTASGLPPLPAEVLPPAAPTAVRAAEVMADPRVARSVSAGRGGRVRDATTGLDLTGQERAVTGADAARVGAAATATTTAMAGAVGSNSFAPPSGGVDVAVAATTADETNGVSAYGLPFPKCRVAPVVSGASADENRAAARAWIGAWRGGEVAPEAASPPAAAEGSSQLYRLSGVGVVADSEDEALPPPPLPDDGRENPQAAPAPSLSPYGLRMPSDRADPVVTVMSADERRAEVRNWIMAHRTRSLAERVRSLSAVGGATPQ